MIQKYEGIRIVPTYYCNKHCNFCYQKTKDCNFADISKIENIIQHIDFIPAYITFMGGELSCFPKESKKLFSTVHSILPMVFTKSIITIGLNCPDWCAIVALDDQYRTIVVKQTRWGIESTTTEFPCGTVERGEEPIETAIREFKEETGIILKRNQLVKIATFNPNPAYFSNMMHVFLAEDLEDLEEILGKAEDQNLDENEDCEVFIRNLDDALVKELSVSGISSAILSALFGYTNTD